jgi:hypothetical protein
MFDSYSFWGFEKIGMKRNQSSCLDVLGLFIDGKSNGERGSRANFGEGKSGKRQL